MALKVPFSLRGDRERPLTPEDLAEIIDNLDAANRVFERRKVRMSPADLSAVSVLNVLKRELEARLEASRSALQASA